MQLYHCTHQCVMRDFLPCTGIASGNFKHHEKQDNKSMLIKWEKKKNGRKKKNKQIIGQSSKVYQRERENYKLSFGSTEKGWEKPLPVLWLLWCQWQHLPHSWPPPTVHVGNFQGIILAKQQRRQLEQALKQSWTRLEPWGQVRTAMSHPYHFKHQFPQGREVNGKFGSSWILLHTWTHWARLGRQGFILWCKITFSDS